jgi:hypothetical protein
LRHVFGIINVEIGEDSGKFKGKVFRSRGVFESVNGGGVIRWNDVLIFRGGIIRM